MSQHRRTTTVDRLRRRFGRFGVLGMIIALVALTLTPPATAAEAPPAGEYTGPSEAYNGAEVTFQIDANGIMSGFETQSYCFDGLYNQVVQWYGMPPTQVNVGEPFDVYWEYGDGEIRPYYELTGTINADGSASGTGRAGFLPSGTCGGYTFTWAAQGPSGPSEPIEPTIAITPSSVTESGLVDDGVQIAGGDFVAGSSVTLTVAGSEVGTKAADGNGAVAFDYYGPLAPGSHAVQLASADGEVSGTLTVTADPEPEPDPSVSVAPGSVSVSQLAADGVVLSGEDFGAGADVSIAADGAAVATVSADGEGAFSYTYAGQHEPGTLTLTASSAAGQDSATVTVTADPEPEPDPSVSVAPGSVSVSQLAADGVVLSGEDFGAGADVSIAADGAAVATVSADGEGAFSYTYAGQHEPGTLTLTASSAAGQDSATVTVTADAPVYDPDVSLSPTSLTQTALTVDGVTVDGTGFPANADVEVRFDGAAVATVGSDADGSVSYVLTREDVASGTYPVALVSGDWSAQANLTVTADPEPDPSVSVTPDSVTVSELAAGGVTFSGEEFGAGADVSIAANGEVAATVSADGEGAFSYTYAGQHEPGTLTLTASSAAGQDSATVTVTADPAVRDPQVTVTPQTVTQSQVRDTGVAVASTGWFAGDEVIVSVGGEEVSRVTADDEGRANAQLTSPNASVGQHTVTVAVGEASAEATFTVVADPDPNPTIPAEPPSEDELTDANRGGVTGPGSAVEGATIELTVPGAEPGSRVGVWAFSEPTYLGAFTVSENRTIQIVLPDGLVGEHRLAVYAEGSEELLGWTPITITQADGGGGGGSDSGGGSDATGGNGSGAGRTGDDGHLPSTGSVVAGGVAGWALLLLLGGAFLIARSRSIGARPS